MKLSLSLSILLLALSACGRGPITEPAEIPLDTTAAESPIVPIHFADETMVVRIFFSNTRFNPNANPCSKVFPVEREIVHTTSVAAAALTLLLQGPTASEKSEGYLTSLPTGLELKSLRLAGGVVEADFSEKLGEIAGACAVQAARAQIESTLRQFPTITEVRIWKNGVVGGALEP
jgi:hypothetical protein